MNLKKVFLQCRRNELGDKLSVTHRGHIYVSDIVENVVNNKIGL
jgi:hypothetical protein